MKDTIPTYLLLELRRRAECERYVDELASKVAVFAFAAGTLVGGGIVAAVLTRIM